MLTVFLTSCIPTIPGGNPTPTPPSDSTVVYKLANEIVTNLNPSTGDYSCYYKDIDSNGMDDIYFCPYNGVYGSAVSNIFSVDSSTQLAIKNTADYTNGYIFSLNDTITRANFPYNHITNGMQSNGTKIVYVGFRILQNNGYHYGWMQIKMEVAFTGLPPYAVAGTIKTTLINYAYKKAPNTSILTGKY